MTIRTPDPKANTTTEAYLAYKAGYLEESELKPVLYEPYLHFDAWLAYWAGLTNEYPLDKNGDPEMLTDEEALVAYLSGVTDTYPEEIKDPYDVRIVGYLKHLVSIRWPEPDYPVNNEEFYLSTMEPTHTSNPVPSSDIELNTAEGKIISVEAYGDTYQQTYSGKNLCNFGTKTVYQYELFPLAQTLPAGTYTFSAQVTSTDTQNSVCFIRFMNGNSGVGAARIDRSEGRTFITVTTSDTADGLYLYAGYNASDSAGDTATFTDIQIESGSTATSYEPYTGGIPAPNPDYPQPIQVVAGEQTVDVRGKNLIDPTNLSFVYSNSPTQIELSTIDDGIRMVNNGGASQGRFAVFRSIDLTPYIGKVVRMKATFGASGGIRLQRIASDGSKRTAMASTTVSDTEISFTVPADLGAYPYLGYVLDVTVGGSTTVDFTNLIATVDSDIEPYQPYQSQSYEINLGKNLFNTTNYSGNVTITGLNSFDANVDTARTVNMYFSPRLPAGTYTLSYDVSKNSTNTEGIRCGVYVVDGGGTSSLGTIPQYDGHVEYTFSSTTEVDRLYFFINSTLPSGSTASVSNIQVEAGASATSFAPHFTPIELCKIGDYQDNIYKSGDDWYVHKECGRHTFDGSENWSTSTAEPGRWNVTGTGSAAGSSTTNYILSDKYIARYAIQNGSIFLSNNAGRISIVDTTHASLNDWKTWLGTNNVTVYFRLASTTDTKITDATLVGQLEALAGADTYNEKTFIGVTANGSNLPALLKVEAYKY